MSIVSLPRSCVRSISRAAVHPITGGNGLDPEADATAWFDAVESAGGFDAVAAAGGTWDDTKRAAVTAQLVALQSVAGAWDAIDVLSLCMWGNAASDAVNIKNPSGVSFTSTSLVHEFGRAYGSSGGMTISSTDLTSLGRAQNDIASGAFAWNTKGRRFVAGTRSPDSFTQHYVDTSTTGFGYVGGQLFNTSASQTSDYTSYGLSVGGNSIEFLGIDIDGTTETGTDALSGVSSSDFTSSIEVGAAGLVSRGGYVGAGSMTGAQHQAVHTFAREVYKILMGQTDTLYRTSSSGTVKARKTGDTFKNLAFDSVDVGTAFTTVESYSSGDEGLFVYTPSLSEDTNIVGMSDVSGGAVSQGQKYGFTPSRGSANVQASFEIEYDP